MKNRKSRRLEFYLTDADNMLLLTKQLFELSNVSRSRLVIWFPLDVMLYAFDLFKGVGNPY